jgi:hypothetical protein
LTVSGGHLLHIVVVGDAGWCGTDGSFAFVTLNEDEEEDDDDDEECYCGHIVDGFSE